MSKCIFYLINPYDYKQFLYFRESEGSFQFGNYRKEDDDLHTVIQHFTAANRVICAILGTSKGMLF